MSYCRQVRIASFIAVLALAVFNPTSASAAATAPSSCDAYKNQGTCCALTGESGSTNVYTKESFDNLIVRDNIIISVRIPGIGLSATCFTLQNDQWVAEKSYAIVKDMAEYIAGFYQYFVGIIGILAVTMILWGAVQWIAAAGNPGKIGSAKEQISAALIGVVLALASYAILRLVNPSIVNLQINGLTNVGAIAQNFEVAEFCNYNSTNENGIPDQRSRNGGDARCGEYIITRAATKEQPQAQACMGYSCGSDKVCVVTRTENGLLDRGNCADKFDVVNTLNGERGVITRTNSDVDCFMFQSGALGTRCEVDHTGCIVDGKEVQVYFPQSPLQFNEGITQNVACSETF